MSEAAQQRAEVYEIQRRSDAAYRLLRDPDLMELLTFIRDGAVQKALHGLDVRDREAGRHLALAIDHLATEMQSRLDTVELRRQREEQARRYE